MFTLYIPLHSTASGDFNDSMGTFIFSQAATQFSLAVDIVNDEVLEATERLLVLAEINSDAPKVSINPEQTTVTITDDDGKKSLFQYSIKSQLGNKSIDIQLPLALIL